MPLHCSGCSNQIGRLHVQQIVSESVVLPEPGVAIGFGFQTGQPYLVCPCGTPNAAQGMHPHSARVYIEKRD